MCSQQFLGIQRRKAALPNIRPYSTLTYVGEHVTASELKLSSVCPAKMSMFHRLLHVPLAHLYSLMLTGRSTASPGPPTLLPIKTSTTSALSLPGCHLEPQLPSTHTCPSDTIVVRGTTIRGQHTTLQPTIQRTAPTMAPKTVVGPEEDVKFLLTIIKQLSGTVSISASP